MTTLQTLARNLAADGRFTWDDARAVLSEANGASSASEVKELLKDPSVTDTMEAGARQCLLHFLSVHAPQAGSIGRLPDGAKLFVKDGVFLPALDAAPPKTPLDYGQSLYHAARIFAEPGQSPAAALSLADATAVVDRIAVGLTQCKGPGLPAGYEAESQAAQQRSASATVLRELVLSLKDASGEGRLLQDKALGLLLDLIKNEDNPGLRDHMAFHLRTLKDAVPTADQAKRIEDAFGVFAPTTPPYDEWFKDGNDTLGVVCHTGTEFFDSEVASWVRDGFTKVKEGGWNEPTVLEKTYTNREGVETKVQLKMYKGQGGTFDDMDDDKTHVVAYSGHSGWGKNVPGELKRAPDESGPTKVMLIHQCCGQGIINKIRDKYEKAQLVTTRYSSIEPEDHFAFATFLKGVSERKSWDEIHDNIAHGGFWQNRDNNYITPADELARMKTRDRDHDGRADLLDRLYDFDTFDVAGDTQTSFVPNDPSNRNRVLVGERLHNAVQFLNVTLGFSHFLDHLEKGNPFVSAGFFTPAPGEEQKVVQITKRKLDIASTGASPEHTFDRYGGRAFDIYEVKLNPAFAHMSEEVLKAAVFFEVAMQEASGGTPADRALQGLLLVAHGLTTDSEYGREQMIFDELKRTLGLPKELTYSDASRYLRADDHVYAGSDESLSRWKAGLSDEVKRALAAAVEPPGVS